ncbi:MAG TPA: lipocalin-like domain-containing protein [Blastocatellia bacterium]|nr:lipocalin-like domain-containing protein [Blastocatellia bacterium]
MGRSQKSEVRSQESGAGGHAKRRVWWAVAGGCSLFIMLLLRPLAFGLLPEGEQEPGPQGVSKGEWREAEAGYRYEFPRDHAAHPDYGLEWWYYTGNLRAGNGRRFGYQLTFFRVGVTRHPVNPSRWAVRDLYMTHFAISDIDRRQFHSFDRINRAGPGWAGAATDAYRVWNEDWSAQLESGAHHLSASDGDYKIDLRLTTARPEVIHGEDGISQKGPSAGNASHYYSLTRLATTGQMTVGGEAFEVEGLSWMDHEFGTSFLEAEATGWDWFSIQLDDGRELMLFEIRRRDGQIDPRSSGTLIDRDGRTTHLRFGEFTLAASDVWRSPASQAEYPTAWTIELPRFQLHLETRAAFAEQELRTTESTGVTYWEGSINIIGTADGQPVTGRGYLEMTGYAGQNMGAILKGDR